MEFTQLHKAEKVGSKQYSMLSAWLSALLFFSHSHLVVRVIACCYSHDCLNGWLIAFSLSLGAWGATGIHPSVCVRNKLPERVCHMSMCEISTACSHVPLCELVS